MSFYCSLRVFDAFDQPIVLHANGHKLYDNEAQWLIVEIVGMFAIFFHTPMLLSRTKKKKGLVNADASITAERIVSFDNTKHGGFSA